MKDQSKTKQTLIQELASLRQRITALEQSESARKQAEEVLRKSQEQLRDAHRLAHIGIWNWIADTDTVTWTEELYRIAGLDPMIPAPTYTEHSNIYAPESWDRLKVAVEKALETGAPYQLELELIRPDGTTRWVNAFGGATYDNHGRVTGLYGTVQDITERKEIEAGLEKIRKELTVIKKTADEVSEFAESVINTVREPLISLDQDLRVVTVSRSFCDFFKVTPEETMGQLIYDLGNKQWDIPKLRELLETILPQKATFDNYEVEHDFATIGRRTMLLNARQIQRVLGKERIILLAIEDITERRKLELEHIKLAAIVESAFDAIIGENFKGIIESWNSGAEVLYGYNANEVIGNSISLIMPPGHPYEYREILAKIAHGETIKRYETKRRRKDGQTIDVALTISPIKDISGKIISASTIASDITERKEIEAGLEKTRKELAVIKKTADEVSEFAESVINTVREPLISLDQDLRVVTVSRSFYDFFKVKPEDTVGQLIYDLGNKQWDIPKLRELLETILPQKATFDNYEVEHDFATIGRRIMLLNARKIEQVLGKEKIILLAIEDITERKQAEAALLESEKKYRELSIIDGLTQLYNSRYFYFQLKIELDRSNRYEQPLTLLLMDLDDFKIFNDAYGHIEGDQVLMRFSQVVKRCLRQTDSAYRYGGEEFTILLPMTTSVNGAVTAERIRAEFKKEHFSPIPDQDAHITVSIGLAQYKQQEDMKAFVHRVDQLMYQAKKNGKDRVCFES